MTKVAVILFPGVNCEEETKRAAESASMEADIVRWNNSKNLSDYDGFIIPGGWSYEDRIRAGVIASKNSIMKLIKKESEKGKPVLGICNGAQILVESGLIPGINVSKVEMALAPNINPKVSGYYCTWIRIKSSARRGRCAFTKFLEKNAVIPMSIAHGEGRFTTSESGLLDSLIKNDQIVFRYCSEDGKIRDDFPVNPNKSLYNIAAICNPGGNILAIMPHPERANWKRQLSGFERKEFREMESAGPGRTIFESMRKCIEERK